MIEIDLKKQEKAPDDWSEFFDYREDTEKLKDQLKDISATKNVIVVGNGGSITSFDAIFSAICTKKNAISVWTMDPTFIEKVKKLYPSENTVVIAVSKSGNTLGQIEALLSFTEYRVIVITEPGKGCLSEIAEKMNWRIIPHPPVGGRFSAGTSSTLAGLYLTGIDINKIQKGMDNGYKTLRDSAYSLSNFYFEKESEGFSEVYVTIYNQLLEKFQNLIIQLMHESVCKNEKGQTFYVSMGPESQHHTNQRFLGGKRTVVGTFIKTDEDNGLSIEVPNKIKDVIYKGEVLSKFDGLKYKKALEAEYLGTKRDADRINIPNVTITLNKIDENSLGELIAFWHLVAFYSSILRKVNPFDQPAVENSKNITLDIIKENF